MDTIKKEAVQYGTVILMSPGKEGKAIASTYTDEYGKFKVSAPAGSYKFVINYVGYAPYEQELKVEKNTDLGTIVMGGGIQIEAAQVIGKLIVSDIDKTTYNIAADPEAPALNALEMMRKVPMITVDNDDNIKLKGQSNFKILVNGKSSAMMNNNYKDVLKGMPASSIKNIEVITNPPAKYDAEGIGGIINIVTDRKAAQNGFNGSVWASMDSKLGWNAGTYMAGSKDKFNVSGTLYAGGWNNPNNHLSAERTNFGSDLTRYQNYTNDASYMGNYYGLNLEMSYEFDTLNLLTFSVDGNLGDGRNSMTSVNDIFDINRNPYMKYTNTSNGTNYWGGVGASLDYQHTFANKKDHTLTASYKLDYNPNSSNYHNILTGDLNYRGYESRGDNNAWGMEHALQVDYFNPINDMHQVEVGLKYTLRPNFSNSINQRLIGSVWEDDLTLKNDLDYNQHIASVYAAYQFKIKKFSVKAGARAEYTINEGTFKQVQNTSLFARYFNIVPYLTLGLKIDDTQSMRLGYTQRLSRPGIWYLNPYIDEQEPLRMQTGNPNLQPELSHTVDLSYGIYKPAFNINASLTGSLTDNSIQQITKILDDGRALIRPENIGIRSDINLNLSAGVRFFDGKLSINLNANAGYVDVKANDGTGRANAGWATSAYLQVQGNPWKDGTVSIMGGYGKGDVSLQTTDQFYYFSSISVAQQFLNKKLRVNLTFNNPWTKYNYYSMSERDPSYMLDATQRMLGQTVRLGISWRFGGSGVKVKKAARTIDNNDVKGGGSKGGGQGGGGGQ